MALAGSPLPVIPDTNGGKPGLLGGHLSRVQDTRFRSAR